MYIHSNQPVHLLTLKMKQIRTCVHQKLNDQPKTKKVHIQKIYGKQLFTNKVQKLYAYGWFIKTWNMAVINQAVVKVGQIGKRQQESQVVWQLMQ